MVKGERFKLSLTNTLTATMKGHLTFAKSRTYTSMCLVSMGHVSHEALLSIGNLLYTCSYYTTTRISSECGDVQ